MRARPWLLLAAITSAAACARSVEPSDGTSDVGDHDSDGLESETPGTDADGSLPCDPGEILCDGVCVDISVSHEHCGACSSACPAGSLIETWDCREGDDRLDNNYCCII